MVELSASFILISAIIFIGFLASMLFERTKIPDILILIVLGLILGPASGVVNSNSIESFIPFFAALALIIILFSAGLKLNIYTTLSQLRQAGAFTLFAYVLTAAIISSVAFFLFRWNLFASVFLGIIVSDTCPTIVNSLLPKLKTDEITKISVNLEAVISGAVSTVLALLLLQFHALGNIGISEAFSSLAFAFSIALVIGIAGGIAWLVALRSLRGKPYTYLLTIASLFFLYGIVETLGGNGAISTLIFGMVLGNFKDVTSVFRMKGSFEPDKFIYQFQDEVSFFVRTFFFVYIGLVFRLASSLEVFLLALACLVSILIAREISIKAFKLDKHPTRLLQEFIIPTGLSAVVLSLLPANQGINILGLTEVILLIVIFTNIVTGAAVYFHKEGITRFAPRILRINKK